MYKQLRIKDLFTKLIFLSFLLGTFLFPKQAFAQFDIPPVPKFQTSVYDYISLLDSSEKNTLEQKLIRYSDTTSTQIVVVIISSTQGENIRYLGARWLEKWGIGDSEKDNGILITLAKDDRKIDINTGYGVEHLLTDALSKRIIELEMIPKFKSNDYSGGLNDGVEAIYKVMNGEYQGTRKSNKGFPASALIVIVFFIFIFVIILIAISKGNRGGKGGSGGRRSGGLDIWDAIILSNMGRGSTGGSSGWGGFGSGSSGGFGGGFGGGMGGGGGASGGW